MQWLKVHVLDIRIFPLTVCEFHKALKLMLYDRTDAYI